MSSNVNNQNLFLDTQFQQFVQFAEGAVAAGKEKAVARLSESEARRRRSPASPRANWAGSSTAPSSPRPPTGSASGRDASPA